MTNGWTSYEWRGDQESGDIICDFYDSIIRLRIMIFRDEILQGFRMWDNGHAFNLEIKNEQD